MAKQKKQVPARIVDHSEDVPGPTNNPATNLMMADITMRLGSYIMRNMVERAFLSGRYGKETARQVVKNRTLTQSLVSVAVAKVAARSWPGTILVSGGILAKTLYERGRSRSQSQVEGDVELLHRAQTPSGRIDTEE